MSPLKVTLVLHMISRTPFHSFPVLPSMGPHPFYLFLPMYFPWSLGRTPWEGMSPKPFCRLAKSWLAELIVFCQWFPNTYCHYSASQDLASLLGGFGDTTTSTWSPMTHRLADSCSASGSGRFTPRGPSFLISFIDKSTSDP